MWGEIEQERIALQIMMSISVWVLGILADFLFCCFFYFILIRGEKWKVVVAQSVNKRGQQQGGN